MRINRGNNFMALTCQNIMIPMALAYDFLSFNHFEDIEVAKSWITFFRRGKNTLYNK